MVSSLSRTTNSTSSILLFCNFVRLAYALLYTDVFLMIFCDVKICEQQPQGDYIELHRKRYGRRPDHFERKRKKDAREVHKRSQIAQKVPFFLNNSTSFHFLFQFSHMFYCMKFELKFCFSFCAKNRLWVSRVRCLLRSGMLKRPKWRKRKLFSLWFLLCLWSCCPMVAVNQKWTEWILIIYSASLV